MPDLISGSLIKQPLVDKRRSNAYKHVMRDEKDAEFHGKTIFRTIYGVDRAWLLLFVVSGVLGPVARVCAQGPQHLMVPDMALVGASCLVILSIGRAVESPIFITMYQNNGQPSSPLHKYGMMIMAVICVVRPFLIYFFADSGFSHIGGIFVAGTLCIVLPFGKLSVELCQNAASNIVKTIENDENMHWSDVMRQIVILRGDLECFWDLHTAGGPWCLILLTEVAGAGAFGLRFLSRQDEHRSSMSSSIVAAATRWFFPKEGQDMDIDDKEYRTYQMVLHYLEHHAFGVEIGGVLISKQLITANGSKLMVGIPAIYKMMTAIVVSHSTSMITGIATTTIAPVD